MLCSLVARVTAAAAAASTMSAWSWMIRPRCGTRPTTASTRLLFQQSRLSRSRVRRSSDSRRARSEFSVEAAARGRTDGLLLCRRVELSSFYQFLTSLSQIRDKCSFNKHGVEKQARTDLQGYQYAQIPMLPSHTVMRNRTSAPPLLPVAQQQLSSPGALLHHLPHKLPIIQRIPHPEVCPFAFLE